MKVRRPMLELAVLGAAMTLALATLGLVGLATKGGLEHTTVAAVKPFATGLVERAETRMTRIVVRRLVWRSAAD